MKPSDQERDQLRAAFAAHAAAGSGSEADPVSADDMWDVIVGEVRGQRARLIIDRVLASPAAINDWQTTTDLVREAGLEVVVADPEQGDDAAEGGDDAPIDELARRRRRSRAVWAGWAAASLAAAAAVFLLLRPKQDEVTVPPTYRVTPRVDIVSTMPPGPVSIASDVELRWKGGPDGARFDVRVMDAKLRVVDTAFDLGTRSYVVPAARLSDAPGDVLYWRVVATGPGGERIESPTFRLKITR